MTSAIYFQLVQDKNMHIYRKRGNTDEAKFLTAGESG